MSSINLGNQILTFDYRYPARSVEFNRLLRGLIKPGIYSGGNLSIGGSGTQIIFAPFIILIDTTNEMLAVRIITDLNSVFNIPGGLPDGQYVAYTLLSWADTVENYLDFALREVSTVPITNEVAFGVVTIASGVATAVDYSVRTHGLYDTLHNLNVQNDVQIDGEIVGGQGLALQNATIQADGRFLLPNARIDVDGSFHGPHAYIDENGNIDADGNLTMDGDASILGGNVGVGVAADASTILALLGNMGLTSLLGATAGGGIRIQNTNGNGYFSTIDFRGNNSTPIARIGVLQEAGGSSLLVGLSNSYGSGITKQVLQITYNGDVYIDGSFYTNTANNHTTFIHRGTGYIRHYHRQAVGVNTNINVWGAGASDEEVIGIMWRSTASAPENVPSTTGRFSSGRIYNAVWNDIAETMPSDGSTKNGHLVQVDLSCDDFRLTEYKGDFDAIAGIQSKEPGFVVGWNPDYSNPIFVALKGMVWFENEHLTEDVKMKGKKLYFTRTEKFVYGEEVRGYDAFDLKLLGLVLEVGNKKVRLLI